MRTMSRIWTMLVVGASLGLILLWTVPARADILTNTGISWSSFEALVADLVGFMYSDYNFGGGATEGVVFSAVFSGKGNAAGLYAYVYQIKVDASPTIKGISIPFLTYPEKVDDMTSFYISGDQDSSFGFGQGTIVPTILGNTYGGAVYDPNGKTLTFNFTNESGNGTLIPGSVSVLVGVFSPLPPRIDKSNMLDTGDEAPADVFTPTPEPSTIVMLLFGFGLMGGIGIISKR